MRVWPCPIITYCKYLRSLTHVGMANEALSVASVAAMLVILVGLSFACKDSTYCDKFVTTFLIQTMQRRLFHPLRAVPGPWANSVSELPATLALAKGNQHIYYRSLHERYGPVVRVSPNELSFASADAREEIYGFRVSSRSRYRNSRHRDSYI